MADLKPTNLDDVLKQFKIFGRYHAQLMRFTVLAYASNSLYSYNFVFFTEDTVGLRCKDEGFGNITCASPDLGRCTDWVYDNPYSFVAEFQIACQEWKRTLVGTVHSLGYMAGLLIIGPLSDRLGRKKAIVITGVSGGIIGLAKSYSPWYWLYIVLEFLESTIGDIFSPVYILNIEIVSAKKRVLYYGVCTFGYIFGNTMLPVASWLIPYWRHFLRAIYAPALLFFFYIFILDESPRWLLTRGKKEKAISIVQKAADKNKLHVDKDVLDRLLCEEEKGIPFFKLLILTFSSKVMVKRCLICIIWWATSTFVHYGLTINSVSLQGNKYINYALVSIVDLPANIIVMYILIKFKRRIPLIASFVTGAVLCLVQPFISSDLPWLSIALYMAGKLMATFYFSITYMYTSELFPTYTRNSMHALCSSIGRIGSIIAPQTPLLMIYWTGLPSLVFGGVSLLAGLATFLVPDISNSSLPDTVEQAEALESNNVHSETIGSSVNRDLEGVSENISESKRGRESQDNTVL